MTSKHLLVLAASLTLGVAGVVGCEDRGTTDTGGVGATQDQPAGERLGEQAEQAGERTGQELDQMGDRAGQQLDQAGQRAGDAAGRTGEQIQSGAQNLRDRASQNLGGAATQPATAPTTPQR